jgi:hypothetical protein
MIYFRIEPEVAGGIGKNSKISYEDGKIREVIYLDYEFQGWLGDDILTTHPCFLVSKPLSEAIKNNLLCGYKFENISISISEEFKELHTNCIIPDFVRIIPNNSVDDTTLFNVLENDFYFYKKRYLIVSEAALQVIKQFNVANSIIYEIK